MKIGVRDKINLYSHIHNNRKVLFIILIYGVFSGVIFLSGFFISRMGYIGIFRHYLHDQYVIISNHFKYGVTIPEQIIIDIQFEDFQRLAYNRALTIYNQTVNKGVFIEGKEEYVSADITYKGDVTKVKIRLKGDEFDHLYGDKWSYRIEVSNDLTLFGMRRFSIHHPKTRNYIYEWLFHKILGKEDIIALRYKFINVILNGKDLGIYALEEHFDKRLIENNQRREGPIIKFNEDLMWEENIDVRRAFSGKPISATSDYGSYSSSYIDGFEMNRTFSDTLSYFQFLEAINLLESFRDGKLKTSDVFDINKLSMYFALTDLMGAQHASRWHNIRFYYNPITSLLEPIGFDGNAGRRIDFISSTIMEQAYFIEYDVYNVNYIEQIFSDPIFYEEYIKKLEFVSHTAYLDQFFSEIDDELQDNLRILYSEFADFSFDKSILYENQQYIQAILHPPKGLHAYLSNASKESIEIELGNIQLMPLEVLGISYKGDVILNKKILLDGKMQSNPVDYRKILFVFPTHFSFIDTMIQNIRVNYRILGMDGSFQSEVFPWSRIDPTFVEVDLIRKSSNIEKFPFLRVDQKLKRISFVPGKWDIQENLILPKGYSVFAQEGLILNLLNFTKIISYSPIFFLGTEENPIIITSSDSTGQGIVVLNADQQSVLEYVYFEKLLNTKENRWELTGSITFYESPVSISHCSFSQNFHGDDFINIVRTNFLIEHSTFYSTIADAVDADFCQGEIVNTRFLNSGNDAMDISGSVIDLRNIYIDGTGDKGISAGENSQLNCNQIEIRNAEIGVASKDLSEIDIQDIGMFNSRVGFTVFQKKPEFGPGFMIVSDMKMDTVGIPYLVENGSKMIIEGKEMKENHDDVQSILYGAEFGKSSE